MLTKKANLLRVINNIYFKKKEPVSLVHFITNRCNARCSFCFIDFDDPNTFKGELSLDEINKLTKNLGESLLNVNLTGGEPFARKDIIDIAKIYLKNTTIQSMYIFILFFIYLATPYDFYWQLNSSAARVIKTLSFSLAFFGLYNLNNYRI